MTWYSRARDVAATHWTDVLKGFAGGTCYLYYAEASRFTSDILEARAATAKGRHAYVQGHTLAACGDMNSAKRAIVSARSKLCGGLLSWWPTPALWYANAPHPVLENLSAQILYHCAVIHAHTHDLDEALLLQGHASQLRGGAALADLKCARSTIRRDDTVSLSGVALAKKPYLDALKLADAEPSLFTARAQNNFGMLMYALGNDNEARHYLRLAAKSADDTSAPAAVTCADVERSPAALQQLRVIGRGACVPGAAVLDSIVKKLLDESRDGDVNKRDFERAECLKLSWRERATSRTNLLNVTVTAERPPASEIMGLLAEICCTAPSTEPGGRTPVLFHKAYRRLDSEWLAGGGTGRFATSIAAGLTELLRQNAFDDNASRLRAVELARDAFALAESSVPLASATRQGIYQYHFAKFQLLQGRMDVADRYINQAILNHGGGAGQWSLSQIDSRLLAEALLLRGIAHPEVNARNTTDAVRAVLMHDSMHNADHPVLVRAMSLLRNNRGGGSAHRSSDSFADVVEVSNSKHASSSKISDETLRSFPVFHSNDLLAAVEKALAVLSSE